MPKKLRLFASALQPAVDNEKNYGTLYYFNANVSKNVELTQILKFSMENILVDEIIYWKNARKTN